MIRHLTWDLQYQLRHKPSHRLSDEIIYKKTLNSAVVAGGFAAWVLGITDRYGDVDIYYNRPVSASTHRQYKFNDEDVVFVNKYPNTFKVIHITDPIAMDIIYTTKPFEAQDPQVQQTAQDYALWLLHNFDIQACKAAIYRDYTQGWCKIILSHPINPMPHRMRYTKYYKDRHIQTKVPQLKHLCQQVIDTNKEHYLRLIHLYKTSPIRTDYDTFKAAIDKYNALTYVHEEIRYNKKDTKHTRPLGTHYHDSRQDVQDESYLSVSLITDGSTTSSTL